MPALAARPRRRGEGDGADSASGARMTTARRIDTDPLNHTFRFEARSHDRQAEFRAALPALGSAGASVAAPSAPLRPADPQDNVVAAVVSLPTGTVLESEGVTVLRAVPMGHKVATRADPERRAGGEVRPDHRLRDRRHRARRACARPQLRHGRARPELPDRRRLPARSSYRDPMGATFKGLRRAGRARRHAQLHRALLDGELLGDGRSATSPTASTAPACSTPIRTSTASSRSRTAPAAAWPIPARVSRRWSACSGATPRIRTSPPRSSSASAARSCRSAG